MINETSRRLSRVCIGAFLLPIVHLSCSVSMESTPAALNVPIHIEEVAPPTRGGAPAVWLSDRNGMLIFGGMLPITGDTWLFDSDAAVWNELLPRDNDAMPAGRCHHTLVSIGQDDDHLMFGGFSFSGRFNDLWRFDADALRWLRLEPSGPSPAPRCLHTAARIGSTGGMLVYGGIQGAGTGANDFFDDTYVYNVADNAWTQVAASGPGKLSGAISFFASEQNAVFLWGGKQVDNFPTQLWRFDVTAAAWEAFEVAGDVPIGREDPIHFWDDQQNLLFMYSGRNDVTGEPLRTDAYELDLRALRWTRLSVAEPPSPRWRASLAFDASTGTGWMFGGWRDFGGAEAFNDTWRYDLTAGAWTRVTTMDRVE